jgi:polysaccharide biosynthesis protein PslH
MFKVLVLSPTPTHPPNAGNRARIRKWLELYKELGVDFHFAFFRYESGDEAAMIKAWGADRCTFLEYQRPRRSFTILQRLWLRLTRAVGQPQAIPYNIDDWRSESLVNEIRRLADRIRPSCVQIEYVFFSHLFDCFDKTVFKILDTHDIMAGRQELFLKQKIRPVGFYTTKEQEAIGLNRADCIVAIQGQEHAYFTKLTRKPVITVGHLVELKLPMPPATAQPTAVFVGSANPVNEDALDFLLKKIWPLIRASIPNAILEIYGAICASAVPGVPGVFFLGEVVDLSQAYERAWLVLSPLRFGTGLKIKSIEALGQGKALVSTTLGSDGLQDGQGRAFLGADTAEDFANHCINVLANPEVRDGLEQRAYEYAVAWNLKQHDSLLQVISLANLC